MKLTWDQVFAWRMRRQLLDRQVKDTGVAAVVRVLCGVQAQVASCAELAVAARQAKPIKGDLPKAVKDKKLIKTWAMRGTLHLLAPEDAPAYLSLLAATRAWEKPVWQRNFVTLKELEAIAEGVYTALDGKVLTREQLTEAVIEHTKDASIREDLTSGWGTVLKPLAFQGYLINGPSDGNRVTFTRPDTYLRGWKGLPHPAEAARVAIPAYLNSYGPASIDVFNQWLYRGGLKMTHLKSWYADLVDAGELIEVDVEGQSAYAPAREVDKIAKVKPFDEVRLLPAFDQYILGPGTKDTQLIGATRRKDISRAGGWISAVVVHQGRIAGTWELKDDRLDVVLFKECGDVPKGEIEAEAERIATFTGSTPEVQIRTG
ncbi:Winged helix DNA-binding domain-containing protein [Micromonospora echinaurantiaca]|uniref:Winged helix DNA-binding domain-containing protein n=1 Tax=Micromonospora echinaurantiaca TaxID=47857 RepID=A0A1C5IHB8_9ACTN|nr:winged helix DNA-binding domain-containing protein [Micromonospora echinaurantiaca]SCG57411.1 Winged helix DNA-binding domain-containing protein [Micromonospora echinaurantiaca]